MKSGKILIVEDEKDLRDIYEIILQRAGYDVCTSKDGKDGLSDIEKCMPDLVLLDIFMPILDGKGFLKNVKFDNHPKMKVIVFSNTSDNTLMNEMIMLGAEKVVTKADLDPKALTELAKSYVG